VCDLWPSDVRSKTMSAGTRIFFSSKTMSPTRIFEEGILLVNGASGMLILGEAILEGALSNEAWSNVRYRVPLASRSRRCRW
jgi:hypothetical protein